MRDSTQTERPRQQSGHTNRKRDGKRAPAAISKANATKRAKLEALLARTRGATLAQLQKELGWQPHTVRAAISGLRKAGHTIDLEEKKTAAKPTGWRRDPMVEGKTLGPAQSLDVEALPLIPAAELRTIWRERLGVSPPPTPSARLMRHALAWELQAEGQGDEAPVLRRQWKAVMKRRADGASADDAISGLARQAAPTGTRLLKSWAGETHEVIVTDNGVMWNGTTYSSLSAVARAITGTPRNGPKFFGLREKTQ